MITKITGEQPFQVLTSNFSISPSQEGYTLQISADGRQYSNLFTVGAGVTRLVTGVAANSFYKLSGNQSAVSINWMKTCVTEGGSGGAGNELTPVTEFPVGAEAGTVVALASGDTYGIYQYDGTDWNPAGGEVDLSAYWTSAETQSAITAVEDHLFDVEQVTASALTELHDGLMEVSGRTVDLSGYYTSGETDEAIAQAVSGLATEVYVDNAVADKLDSEDGRVISTALNALHDGLLEVSGRTVDLSGYYTSGETDEAIAQAVSGLATEVYVDNAVADKLDSEDGRVISTALNALHDGLLEVSASTSGKADAANIEPNTGYYSFPEWNEQGIVVREAAKAGGAAYKVNGETHYAWTQDAEGYTIYAPMSAGTAGEVLVSSGPGNAPVWSAVTGGGGDMSNYWNSAETKSYVDSAATNLQDQINTMDEVVSDALNDLNGQLITKVSSSSVSTIWKGTQAQYDAIVTKDPTTFYIIVSSN